MSTLAKVYLSGIALCTAGGFVMGWVVTGQEVRQYHDQWHVRFLKGIQQGSLNLPAYTLFGTILGLIWPALLPFGGYCAAMGSIPIANNPPS